MTWNMVVWVDNCLHEKVYTGAPIKQDSKSILKQQSQYNVTNQLKKLTLLLKEN